MLLFALKILVRFVYFFKQHFSHRDDFNFHFTMFPRFAGILLLTQAFLITCFSTYGQDTLTTRYGDVLLGKVERITAEKIYFKTAYRANAVDIKLSEVVGIGSVDNFLINDIKNRNWIGQLVFDSIQSNKIGLKLEDSVIFFPQKQIFEITKNEKKKFKDGFRLGINLGYSQAKTDNTIALSLGLISRYKTRRWDTGLDYQDFASAVGPNIVTRTSLDYNLSYLLPLDWFVNGKASLFSSSEQDLDLRRTYSFGFGKYLIHRESQSLNFSAGLVSNKEQYLDNLQTFTSTEATFATHWNGGITDNLRVILDWAIFPSLSQESRVRNNLKANLIYTFLNHFNIGLNYVLNTDNSPPLETEKTDYIFEIKLGWTLQKQ